LQTNVLRGEVNVELLAGDAQAKLALIIRQIYLNGERMDSVHPSVCTRQLESMELSIAANFAARRLSAFFQN